MIFNQWVTEKPVFNEPCLVIAATKMKYGWNYTLFQVKAVWDSDEWYWGLLDSDGSEWGALRDLHAEKYMLLHVLT